MRFFLVERGEFVPGDLQPGLAAADIALSLLGGLVTFLCTLDISDIVIQEASKGDETHAQRRCQMIDVFQGLKIDAEVKEMVNLVSEGKRGDSDD